MTDEAEQSIPSRGSHGDEYELPGGPIFSERFKMAHAAWEWCAEKGASVSAPVNIVTALFSLGLVVKRPTLSNEEREAILLAVEHGENTTSLGPLRPIWTLTLRRLLEQTK